MARGGFPKRHTDTKWNPAPAWVDGWTVLLRTVAGDGGSLSAIVGGRGVGKTQMATAIARLVCVDESSKKPMKDTPSVYDKAMGIFVAIRQAMKTDEGELSAIRKYVTPRLLVIDEIQERGETEWEDRVLTHIIDKRYDDPSKHTIIVGNCTPESAAKALGSSVVSRIKERGQFIVCDWPSFR